jgi:hypothetical protein
LLTLHPSHRSVRLVLAFWLCALVAGCNNGEKPVGDAEKYHPNGIGIDIESRNVPGQQKP